MSLRRGFNRAFVVAWVVWALFGIGWGMSFMARERAGYDDLIYKSEHGTYRATESELANWRKQRDDATFSSLVRDFGTTRDGLKLLAFWFLVFPAIVYAVAFATGWAIVWVYRGFFSIDSRGP